MYFVRERKNANSNKETPMFIETLSSAKEDARQ